MKYCLTAAVLLLGAAAPAAQEIRTEVLDKLKSATGYVVVEGRGTGSGFLFLKRGTTGYFMTCEHVVGGASTVKVVLWSGTKQEKLVVARVVATDPHRDIACLIVRDTPDLPAPLELGQKTVVRETETVYAAGFPFGAMLSAGSKNPEITISKSSVSSIRRNDEGNLAAVQISGEVNPGNSGGPLITPDGRVIGVVAAKVGGTGTAFAVPPEEIQGFLKGRVKGADFRKLEGSAARAKYDVVLHLVDPLATLKGVGVAWIDRKEIKTEPEAEKDGTWRKAHGSMKTASLKIDEDRATGSLEFTNASKTDETLEVLFQCFCTRGDGATVWTQPDTWTIYFSAGSGPSAPSSGGRRNPGNEGPKGTDDPEPPAAPTPSAPSIGPINLPDAVPIAAEQKINSVYGGLILSPDGSTLYALDLSEGQLQKINPDTLAITDKVDVHESSVTMALTPDGKTIYIGGRSADSARGTEKAGGTIQAISTSTLKVTSRMDCKGGIVEIVATDRGLVAATVQGQWGGLAVIDVAKKSEEYVQLIFGGGTIRLTPDQKRAYVGDTGLSPADFRCVQLWRQKGQYPTYDSTYHGDFPLGGYFEISPDGKFLVAGTGPVLRLGKTRDADLRHVATIDPSSSFAMARGCSSLFAFSNEGFLKSYKIENFELQKSVKVGVRCERTILDTARRRIHAVAGAAIVDKFWRREPQAGRLVSFSLGEK